MALHDEVFVLLVLERQRAQCARRRPLHLRGLVDARRIGKRAGAQSQKQCTTSLQMPCIHTRLCRPHAQRVLILLNYYAALVGAAPTFASKDSRRATSGGTPPSLRTRHLMLTFSWARLVIASAARRATLAPGPGGQRLGTCCFSRPTRPCGVENVQFTSVAMSELRMKMCCFSRLTRPWKVECARCEKYAVGVSDHVKTAAGVGLGIGTWHYAI